MRKVEERLRRQERHRGWRGWTNIPLDQWPRYASDSLIAALPGALDQLPTARLDELLCLFQQAESEDNAGSSADKQGG